jgi:hypothetical protein
MRSIMHASVHASSSAHASLDRPRLVLTASLLVRQTVTQQSESGGRRIIGPASIATTTQSLQVSITSATHAATATQRSHGRPPHPSFLHTARSPARFASRGWRDSNHSRGLPRLHLLGCRRLPIHAEKLDNVHGDRYSEEDALEAHQVLRYVERRQHQHRVELDRRRIDQGTQTVRLQSQSGGGCP